MKEVKTTFVDDVSNIFSKPDDASVNGTPSRRGWQSILLSPLWLCLLLALIVRIWLVIHTHGFLDGDENLVGIQAQHILRGERPIYYYGQPYMGNLEAYLIALIFAIAGSSVWTLRAEPTLLSLVLVCLAWQLAGALADGAGLSAYARRWFMTVAGLFAALPPLYDMVMELRTWGGHIEIYILMLWLLLSVVRLTQRWAAGAGWREIALRWAVIGFIVGLAMWVYPLIICAILAATIWIVGYFVLAISKARRSLYAAPKEPHIPVSIHIKNILLVIAALPTCLIGFAPGIYWGAQNHWTNVLYLISPGSDGGNDPTFLQHYSRLAILRGTARLYMKCIVPHVVGGSMPTESLSLASVHSFEILTVVGIACIAVTIALTIAAIFYHDPLLQSIQRLALLPIIFGACCVFIFFFSGTVGASILQPCIHDGVGRYAAPVLLALPFVSATIFTAACMWIMRRRGQNMVNGRTETQPGEPTAPGEVSAQDSSLRSKIGIGALGVLLIVYLCIQGNTYLRSDPGYTFQSFACVIAPMDNGPIITYMESQHIRYAWGTNTLGNSIEFKTDGKIIVADPRMITWHLVARLPGDVDAVHHADRASILDMANHNDPHPPLLTALDQAHVIYRVARFPTQPGNIDILVVTPLNRTVTPDEAKPRMPC